MPNILIVDDDDDIRRVLRRILETDGHVVVDCANGQDALHAMGARRPDLVITDVYMPEMDGIEFLVHLRERDPDLPVLAVSGGSLATADFVLEDASQLGANAVLSKPFDIDEMRRTVRRLLAGGSSSA
jgi:CheY-like chemotaxis protein